MTSLAFRNLIRFRDETSTEYYGDIPEGGSLTDIVGQTVPILDGDIYDLRRTEKTAVVHELLSPVKDVPLFVCVGLNYADHAKEADLDVPPNPVIFSKPPDALADPLADIPIPANAKLLDYEGELCIVVGRTGKNICEADALSYVLGFTAGNDVSSRYWQRPPYSGGQFSYAKSFDRFAPLGPTLLNPAIVDSSNLTLQTRVNGELRQNGRTADMLFSVAQIVAHVSRGTTLRQGTVIMTGTPAGIAAKLPGSPWLRDGDVVEVEISGIGRLQNRMVFEQAE